jgi:7-carboxy-7-deazaguanine synthase
MLTINEIYLSIQGESTHAGRPCVFVRLTACDLRCTWCDTPYAFTEGRKMTIEDVVAQVETLGCTLVEITGGEPLLQADVYPLMRALVDHRMEVLLETGGHIPLDQVPHEIVVIVDVKCPASGEAARMCWPNLDRISVRDEVKFVIEDRADFDYACEVTNRFRLASRAAAVQFSPAHGRLAPAQLAEWILASGLPVRLQIQQHKYIWDPAARGV